LIWYNNFPEESGSLSSLPIRENFDFLKVGLDVHASSSANPHSTTLDQVCEVGAETDVTITVTASGSVVKSLRVQNNELVGGNLEVKGNILADSSGSVLKSLRVQNNLNIGGELFTTNTGQTTIQSLGGLSFGCNNGYIHFYSSAGSSMYFDCGNIFWWRDKDAGNANRMSLDSANGNLWVDGDLSADGNVNLNVDYSNVDAVITFCKPTSGYETLIWDKTDLRFDFSNNLYINGTIEVSVSGSVLKSLNVVNDLQVGGNIIGNVVTTDTLDDVCERGAETDQPITVTSSGSVVKSLRVQNNEQIGGSLEVEGEGRFDGDIYVNYDYSNADAILYFGNPDPGTQTFRWNKTYSIFELSHDLKVTGVLYATGDVLGLNTAAAAVDPKIEFYKTSGHEELKWNKDTLRFEFSNNLYINGTILSASSGSVVKSLRVQNNALIGGNLEVKGSLIGDVFTKTIILPIEAATLPDGTAGNLAATIERVKSSAGAPSPHFMRAWFNSTTDSFLYWSFRMPADYGSGLTAKIQYTMPVATSGSVVVGVALMAVTPGDAQDIYADAMGTINSATDTVPGTVGYMKEISISLTNTDSLVAGDFVVLYLSRDANNASDTAKNDLDVVAFSLEYTPA